MKIAFFALSALVLTAGLSMTTKAFAQEEHSMIELEMKMQNLSAHNQPSNESVSPEQLEAMKKQIEELKLKQIEANKAMEELDRE